MARVSVIVAAFEAAGTIEDTLRSVLAQSYGDWEIIVGDDCSTDATRAACRGFGERVRVVRSATNMGTPAATRMMAVAESRAELIAFLDGDDLWQSDYLATMVGAYDRERERGPSVGAVCCDAELLHKDGSVAAQYVHGPRRPAGGRDRPRPPAAAKPRLHERAAAAGRVRCGRRADERAARHRRLRPLDPDRRARAADRLRRPAAGPLSRSRELDVGRPARDGRSERGGLPPGAAARPAERRATTARAARDPHAGRRGPRRRAVRAAASEPAGCPSAPRCASRRCSP